MTMYVGLTNDPDDRRIQHGNPLDWKQTGAFASEATARDWEKRQLAKNGIEGGPGGKGWHYGYWYTISARTREDV